MHQRRFKPAAISRLIFARNTLVLAVAFLLVALLLLWASDSRAEEKALLNYKDGKLSVTLLPTKPEPSLLLKVESPALSSAEIFGIENPWRIVIDIPGVSTSKNSSSLLSTTLLKAVRIGRHENKMRIVLDVAGSGLPEHRWTVIPPLLELHISPNAQVVTPTITARPAPTLTAAPIATATMAPIPTATAAPAATATILPTLTSMPTSPPTFTLPPTTVATTVVPKPAKTAPAVAAARTLAGIIFGYRNGTPAVELILGQKMEYKLAKKGDKLYQLTISDCTLASEHLALPHYPPHDFAGFTYLAGGAKDGNIEISIGIDRGAVITSYAKDSSIILKAEVRQ